MAKKEKYPAVIYVRKEKDGDAEFLLAFEKAEDVIEEDGPTVFAQYKLDTTFTGVKKAHIDEQY